MQGSMPMKGQSFISRFLREIEEATAFDHYYSAQENVDLGLADRIVNFDAIMADGECQ